METNDLPIPAPANRQAVISLVFAALTVISFCLGALPIPFTSIVCIPTTVLFGVLALGYGIVSLYKLRAQKESGHHMAWAGIAVGSFALLCTICAAIGLILVLYFSPDALHNVPLINQFLQALRQLA